MKKKIKYIIPSVITFVIIGIIFFNGDIYPFGSKPLIQVDADYIYIPVMYKIWDFLHHGGSLFYIDMGIGNSIYAPLIIQGSLYSPLNLLLLLIKRSDVINFFSVFLMIKLCLISLTSYIYINNKYEKINDIYKIIFSILYTFSGFFLLNYFNIIWLDIVILFPLLVLYLDEVLKNQDELGYIIILALSLIITFYFSFFVLVFILLYSAVNLYFSDRKIIKKVIFKLGKSTLIAFLISAFSSLPLIYQIFISSRFEYEIAVSLFDNIAPKSLYLLFSPLFIVIFSKLVSKKSNLNIDVYKYIILLLLYIIPLVFEPINMMMHGGSYWSFPYRYGFIVSFILMDAGLYYISKCDRKRETVYKRGYVVYFMMIALLLAAEIFLRIKYVDSIKADDCGILLGINDMSVYKHIIYIIIPIFISYIFCLLFENKKLRLISLCVVSLYSIISFSTLTIFYNPKYFLTTSAWSIYDNMENIPKDGRYKVEYTVYGPYYGLVLGVDSLDNWLHLVPNNVINMYKKMGYYLKDDKIYSYGGTIFTDWFLNIKYVFTSESKEDDMYTNIAKDKDEHKELYKINYSNNYGLLVDSIAKIKIDNRFEFQNEMYSKLFNSDKKIIDYHNYSYEDIDLIEFDYDINEDGYLYFYSDMTDNVDYIIVNEDYIYSLDDSIRYLGSYNDKVSIKIRLFGYDNLNFDIGFIKKSDIQELSSSVVYKNNKYYVDSDDSRYLVMPINSIPGLSAYNNGVKVETYKYLDNFVAVKVNKGKNVISFKYKQPMLNVGIILGIIGVLLLIFYKKIVPNELILNICYYLYIFIILIMLIYVYLYSFIKFL